MLADIDPARRAVQRSWSSAVNEATVQGQEQARLRQQQALEQRQAVLRQELDHVRNPADAEVVKQFMRGAADAMYADPDDLSVKVGVRTMGDAARAQRDRAQTFVTAAAITEELKRSGALGTRWNDEERAKWEAELDEAAAESADRKAWRADPEVAFEVAAASVASEESSPRAPGDRERAERLHLRGPIPAPVPRIT